MYPEQVIRPMIKELTDVGFVELKNSNDVDGFIDKNPFCLIVINSVCGCAASNARPALIKSISSEFVPPKIATVFAGVDKEAVDRVRHHVSPYPPSSPSIFLLKNGEPIFALERHDIEGKSKEHISDELIRAYKANND